MDNEASNPENKGIQKTSFWNFLKELDKIEIPIIQRDYAQGREGEEYSKLRGRFIENLKRAMDSGEQLNLDFIYGSEIPYDDEKNGKKKRVKILQPLDGQQRLTTLWLLHWYIALRAGQLTKENCEVLGRFAYETRISSREFCQSLCRPENFTSFTGGGIVDFIENQIWFYSVWKQEPTIQSMLRMLGGTKTDDGIECVFNDIKDYGQCWHDLTSPSSIVPIVFYYTPLKNFGLSDDLYIKMNARGKQLTPFENFKANLITYLRKEEYKSFYKDISTKLDNIWTDIFWENKSDEKKCGENKIDEIYLAFLNRFFWNELFIAKKQCPEDDLICFEGDKLKSDNSSFEYLSKDDLSGYYSMDPYKFLDGEIPTTLFERLQIVLDRYKAYMDLYKKLREDGEKPLSDLVPDDEWNSIPFPDILFPKWVRGDFEFIPEYRYGKNGEEISMLKPPSKRVMFYALCKYFTDEAQEAKTTKPPTKESFVALKQWMRVVCNLVSGRDTSWGHILIRDYPAAKNAIKHIGKLDSQRVLEDLRDKQTPFRPPNSVFEWQWNEEIIKAKKILDKNGKLSKHDGKSTEDGESTEHKTWERIIIEAEEYAFFKGSIRFLYQGKDGKEEDWDNFDTKWKHARNYFKGEVKEGEEGEEDAVDDRSSCLKNDDEMKLLKALISRLDPGQFVKALFHDYKVFNNRPGSWRYYLLHPDLCAPIHELLLGHKDIKNPLDRACVQEEESDKILQSTIRDILYLLSQTTLLNYIAKEIPDAWIRNGYHNHCAIYRKKGGGVFLNAKWRDAFFKKNAAKIKLFEEKEIIIDKNIEGRYLLFGPNVYFDYFNDKGEKVGHFLWCEDEYIYLQEPDGEDSDTSLEKDAYAEKPDQRWYCFDTKGLNETQIMEKLDKLKNDYEEDMRKKAQADPPSNS